jgi:Skp family chaperone for outer membrane proteins
VLEHEIALRSKESVIADLNSVIKEKASELQSKSDDLEKKSQELSQHKTKSANEVSNFCTFCWMVGNACSICLRDH